MKDPKIKLTDSEAYTFLNYLYENKKKQRTLLELIEEAIDKWLEENKLK